MKTVGTETLGGIVSALFKRGEDKVSQAVTRLRRSGFFKDMRKK